MMVASGSNKEQLLIYLGEPDRIEFQSEKTKETELFCYGINRNTKDQAQELKFYEATIEISDDFSIPLIIPVDGENDEIERILNQEDVFYFMSGLIQLQKSH